MTNSEAQDALRRFAETRDPAAFEQLVKGHIDLVYAAARRQVSDPATADDVTQQVFVLLANKAAKLSDAVRLPGWLLRTCRHCAADANRARLRRQHHEQEAAAMKSQTAPIDPDTQEILRQVDAALADLGETDRTAIAMRYLQQRSVREVADALKVTEDAAKKRLTRAMERLRGRLAPLRTAMTMTAVAVALEQAASITAPPAMASTIATTAVACKVAVSGGFAIHGIAAWKIGVVAAVILLAASGVAIWIFNGPSSQPIAVNPPAPTTETGKLLPMPAVASLTPQQVRIYQLLSEFRLALPSDPFDADKWVAAVREMTQIGAPAVPALCTELDRSERDTTQRLLISSLRVIRDRRAVPSLIRALSRVPLDTNDYGVDVNDPDLRTFLDSHSWHTGRLQDGRDVYGFNPGIFQCTEALEAITHHSEEHGPLWKFDAKEQREFSERWKQWWAEHADSSLDLSSVDAVRYNGDLVAAVATATMPPLFPTGPQIHLTDVREANVFPQGLWDTQTYLNLSTGKVTCIYEGSFGKSGEKPGDWFRDSGFDVSCEVMTPNSPANPPGQLVASSMGFKTWQIDNARFDKIEDEVRGSASILHDVEGPGGNITPDADRKGMFEYPVTFLFQTSRNRFGILQETGPVEGQSVAHVRYRLWPEAVGATQPATTPSSTQSTTDFLPGATFGAAHEVTLFDPGSGRPASLNLKTGKMLPQTVDVNNPILTKAKDEWAAKSDIDLWTIIDCPHDLVGLRATPGRRVSVPVSDEAWDQMSPQSCAAIAGRARMFVNREFGDLVRIKEKIPGYSGTWVVNSVNGSDVVALVQIVEVQPTELKLRYKLVEMAAGK